VEEQIQIGIHGHPGKPTLIYLPGMHGDCTLVTSLRAEIKDHVRFVEISYPRTTGWTLSQYGTAVTDTLRAKQISQGWILGESFSSQVAWAILDGVEQSGFEAQGLILAGGFVRYPLMSAVLLAQRLNQLVPMWLLKLACNLYARYAKLRHRRAPETLACLSQSVHNRAEEVDRRAIYHRYSLIAQNDLRAVARRFRLPVYQLCGFFDPVVPWPLVQPWLKRNCPGFRASKIVWCAGHNVLAAAPRTSAEWIRRWIVAAE